MDIRSCPCAGCHAVNGVGGKVVEGSGNLQFNLDCLDEQCTGLFYSRRIGRLPQGIDNLPDSDDVFTSTPAQTTILGAAKLTGRVGKFSIDRLVRCLDRLDYKVDVVVRQKPRRASRAIAA